MPRRGEIPDFTGISNLFEESLNPELVIESDKKSLEDSVTKVMTKIEEFGYVD